MNPKDLNSVRMLLDEAYETSKLQRDLVMNNLESNAVNIKALEKYVGENRSVFTKEELKESDKLDEIYQLIKTEATDDVINTMVNKGMDHITAVTNWVAGALKDMNDILDSEDELDNIESELNGEIQSVADYISSEEYDKRREKNIIIWKEALKKEINPVEISNLKMAIYITENRYTLAYMFERLNNPDTHEKEKQQLIDLFFNREKSQYMMDKFRAKSNQFGVSNDVFKYLFNIEENYLEEKYHVFNNFFLQAAMRFIGHCGVKEVDEAKDVLQNMLKLVYNRFYSDEVRELFLNTIRGFLDQFEDQRELFNEKNILHPGHPHRIQKDKEREAKMRIQIYDSLVRKGYVDLDQQQEQLNQMSINELIAFYNERDAEAQSAEEEKENAKEESLINENDSDEEDLKTDTESSVDE